jgi:cytochrome P450
LDIGSLASDQIPFAIAFDSSQNTSFYRFLNPFYKFTELFTPHVQKNIKYLRQFGLDVVRDRMNGNSKNADLMQLFLDYRDENGNALTEDQLVDQVLNFIIAGRDTTAQALSWTIFCLSQNPKVLEKLLQEIAETIPDQDYPTYDQVRAMKYAKGVFFETLRLYPSVPRELKMCVNDDVLPNGVEIKKGWTLYWELGAMGRSPKIWDEPLKYDPERWLSGKVPAQSVFPAFHGGPRVCLGKTLAELQGVFVLVSLLKKFSFEVVNSDKVVLGSSLTSPMKYGLDCRVIPRD